MSRPSAARLAWRHGRRALGGGEARILLLALVVAVATVAAITQITARVQAALVDQSAQTLGADLRLDLRAPLDTERARRLAQIGVTTATASVFPSVATHGKALLLVSVKAVSPNFPLRGAVSLRDGPTDSPLQSVHHGPPEGSVWVGQRVLEGLGLHIGDRLTLGTSRPVVSAVIVAEPDAGPGFANLAPRLLMAQSDVAATGLIGPGSRVRYQALIAGTPTQIAAAQIALAPTLTTGERMQTPAQADRALARALDRARIFLNLAALVAVALAGVAIALAARQHAASRLDEIALMKTLGAARGLVTRLLAWQLIYIGTLGIGLGLLLGYAAQRATGLIVSPLFDIVLPPGHAAMLWSAPAVGAVLLAGFAWPALSTARRTPPARILSRASGEVHSGNWLLYGAAITSVALLAAAATRDPGLTLWVLGAALASTLLFALAALALLGLIEQLRRRAGAGLGPGPRLGLAALSRRRATTVTQIVAFGIGLTLVFLLVVVRGDLLAGWQTTLATNAPNRFLINITPSQTTAIGDYLATHGIGRPRFYPIVRGRLTQVHGAPLEADPQRLQAAGELARRALNLSWSAHLKSDNRIVAGHWWRPADRGAHRVSIDRSVARRLQVAIGDQLTFDVAGQPLTATVESIRDIDWSSLQANFYVLFPPGVLDGYPASYITSFHVPASHRDALAGLVHQFTNVSVIDVTAILARIETLIQRLSVALELVFGATLAAALVVLLAAVQTSRAERTREAALLRVLGARSRWLRQAAMIEYLMIGVLSSVIAAVVAQACEAALASRLLHLEYRIRWEVWLAAVVLASAAVAAAGLLALGRSLRTIAWQNLRDADSE